MGDPTVQGHDDTPTAGVQQAMAGVSELDEVPVADHVARFDAVHRALVEALSAIDGA